MDSKKHDELVLQYLDTIDTYQSQKKQFSSELSAGYLALAQANFHSAGVRYGKDFYDERMTAIKRIQLDPRSENTVFSLKPRETADDVVEKPIDTQSSTIRRRKGAGPETEEKVEEEEAKVDEKEVEKKPQIDIQDPIRWFGILVPQSLRTSQNHFSSSVDYLLPLITTIRKLDNLFTQISYLRNTHYLYKILTSAPTTPLPVSLPLSTLDIQSGYIHLCSDSQVEGVVSRFMDDSEKLWVLRIPYERVVDNIKWERVDGLDEAGERFPHLFAGLGKTEVDAWTVLQKSDEGWGVVFNAADWNKLESDSTIEGSNIN